MSIFESQHGLIFAQTPGGDGAVAIQSVWDFVLKGGPMMIPIILCSLFALGVIAERIVSLRLPQVIPPGFLDGLQKIMRDAKQSRRAALDYCVESASPLGSILSAGIKRLGGPITVLEKHVQDAGDRVVFQLRKNLRVLTVVASVCPLLGLLGTIIGMIEAFQTVASSGEALGKTELLAEGIYEAMITTAAGLLVAIPVMISYNYLAARIDGLVSEMDRMTLEFLEEHAYANPPVESNVGHAVSGAAVDDGNGREATGGSVRGSAIATTIGES